MNIIIQLQQLMDIIPKCIKGNNCFLICNNKGCQNIPFMCKQDDCECESLHIHCQNNIKWKTLKEKIEKKLTNESSPIIKVYLQKVEQVYLYTLKSIQKSYNDMKNVWLTMGLNQTEKELYFKLNQKNYCDITGTFINTLMTINSPNQSGKINPAKYMIKKKQIQEQTQLLIQSLAKFTKQQQQLIQKQQQNYLFTQYKGKAIVVSQDNKTAKQNQYFYQRFIIVEPVLTYSKHTIKYQIKKLSHWIGIGICFKNKVINNNYKFQSPYTSHGAFMLSSNGYTWSQTFPEENIKDKGFKFTTGDVIIVQFDPLNNKLIFLNEKKQQKIQLKIELNPFNNFEEITFCANLCSLDDELLILDNK